MLIFAVKNVELILSLLLLKGLKKVCIIRYREGGKEIASNYIRAKGAIVLTNFLANLLIFS